MKILEEKRILLESIGDRIRELRRKMKINCIDFAKKVNMSTSALLRVERGEVNPGLVELLNICEVLGIKLNDLLKSERKDASDFVYIPLVEGKISAGSGLVPQNNIMDFLAFKKEWIQRKGDISKMVLIRVSGDSMETTLYDGDIVMVDTARNYIDPQGGIYAITIDDEIMVKRLQYNFSKTKQGKIAKSIKVISDNPVYGAFELNVEDIIVNGKVIWYGREL